MALNSITGLHNATSSARLWILCTGASCHCSILARPGSSDRATAENHWGDWNKHEQKTKTKKNPLLNISNQNDKQASRTRQHKRNAEFWLRWGPCIYSGWLQEVESDDAQCKKKRRRIESMNSLKWAPPPPQKRALHFDEEMRKITHLASTWHVTHRATPHWRVAFQQLQSQGRFRGASSTEPTLEYQLTSYITYTLIHVILTELRRRMSQCLKASSNQVTATSA